MITFIESFVKELEWESIATKKMLALVPADQADFKPHEKSMRLKDLATHIADLPSWISMVLTTDELDFAAAPYNPKQCNGGEELVACYEEYAAIAKTTLLQHTDAILEKPWTLKNGDTIFVTTPKLDMIRHSYCQIVHHRAQLGVYLRLLNIPIPGVYGPSADEPAMK